MAAATSAHMRFPNQWLTDPPKPTFTSSVPTFAAESLCEASVELLDTETWGAATPPVTYFLLRVRMGASSYCVRRRFKDFDTLHAALSHAHGRPWVPELPPKQIFKNESAEFLQRDNWERLRHVRRELGHNLLHSPWAGMGEDDDWFEPQAMWQPATPSGKRCDEAIEEAVGLLGRAQEQLHPVANDPTRASLQPADLRGVLTAVADAVRLLRLGDPDRPIKPSEWYRLVERPDDSVAEMVTAAAGAAARR